MYVRDKRESDAFGKIWRVFREQEVRVCVCCDVQNDVVMHFHSLFFLSGPSCCPMVVICNMGLLLVMIIAIR